MAILHLHDAWVKVRVAGHGEVKIMLNEDQVASLKAGKPTKIHADLPNGDRYENILHVVED